MAPPRGAPRHSLQAWLDDYRWEHNHVRPHEALRMKTPASVWRPSARKYDPQPPRWEYPPGAWVLKVDPQGKIEVAAIECTIAQGSSSRETPDGNNHLLSGDPNPAYECSGK